MTSSRTRIGVLASLFGAALAMVLLHLWILMVSDQEVWARRSTENRWAFRSVPSQRGALLDRTGRVLAWDVATTRVSVYYHRFRLYHVIGAAVHGAMHWASLQPGREGTIYGFELGARGPDAAAEDLLAMPVRVMKPGYLPKDIASELATYATTVLSQCSGLSRRIVYRAMREAAVAGSRVGIGDVLTLPRADLLLHYRERLRDLRELDQLLAVEQAAYAERIGRSQPHAGLVATLEKLRRQSLSGEVVSWTDRDGELRTGSRKEDIRQVFAHDVAFELAASLRVDRGRHPGIDVEPSVRRERVGGRDTSLGVLLGQVKPIDRTVSPDPVTGETWVGRFLAEKAQRERLDELVPAGVVAGEQSRQRLQEEARRRYEREMLVRERRGLAGMEAAYNDDLMGLLGMRFIEHDSRRREQRLWNHLRVESGEDVRLTFDVKLQAAAEGAVRRAYGKYRQMYEAKATPNAELNLKYMEAALAVIDAKTGDILAVAGAPITGDTVLRVPGFSWRSNGSLGSVVKPFMMIEHLESMRFGRPHRAVADIKQCPGYYIDDNGRKWMCDKPHWQEGRDPVQAIAQSCNSFFYQAGIGMQAAGVERALQRFGLLNSSGPNPFASRWQSRVRGLALAAPEMSLRRRLPNRTIGYGVASAPVNVARAYAALATGVLSTLGLRSGEQRAQVPLSDVDESLAIVREGLRQCVTRGTGRRLALLKELEVHAKTGTAEVSLARNNNAWFAGYLPWTSSAGTQLAFAAVVYRVPDRTHGGDAAGNLVVDFLSQLQADPELLATYLTRAGR